MEAYGQQSLGERRDIAATPVAGASKVPRSTGKAIEAIAEVARAECGLVGFTNHLEEAQGLRCWRLVAIQVRPGCGCNVREPI